MRLKELIQSIEKKEWRFVIILAVVMIVVTALPYVYAYLNAPQGYFYNGIHSLTPGDSPVYFSYINQIKAGNWQVRDNFTSELQPQGLLNLFWLGVGLLAWLLHLRADLAFHFCRLLLIPFFLVILCLFFSYVFTDLTKRKLAMIFCCFASGIGAYFAGIIDKLYPFNVDATVYYWPIDLWVPEANIFSILYQTPHFIFSITLCVLVFLLVLLAWENNKYVYSLAAGLLALVWFNFHPFYFPYLVIILGGFVFYKLFTSKKLLYLWHYFLVVLLSVPFVIYHYYKIKTDFVLGARASQNVLNTPPLIFVLLGFGFLFIGFLAGLIYLIKKKQFWINDKMVFLANWVILSFVLLYSLIFFRNRFLQGLEIPLVVFTIIFLVDYLWPKIKWQFIKDNVFILGLLFVLFFGFSTFFNLTRDLIYFKNNLAQFYLPNEYRQTADWLAKNNPNDQIVLSYEYSGLLITSLANVRTYLAHPIETISYFPKRKQVNDLLANYWTDQEIIDFLKNNNIKFLFYSELENKYAQYQPQEHDYWQLVFQQGKVAIYQFNN